MLFSFLFPLDEVGYVHGHLFDLGVVEGLNVLQSATVIRRHEVDCDSLPSKPASTPNSVDVVLPVGRQVVVDDEGHLLDVDAPGKQVGRDEDSTRPRPELSHDHVSLTLLHVSVDG